MHEAGHMKSKNKLFIPDKKLEIVTHCDLMSPQMLDKNNLLTKKKKKKNYLNSRGDNP